MSKKERGFWIFGIGIMLLITYLAFTIPSDPYKIFKSMTGLFDLPIWCLIIMVGGFIDMVALISIYDKTERS